MLLRHLNFLEWIVCCVKNPVNVPADTKDPPSLFLSQVMEPWRPRPSAWSLYYCWLCSASIFECSAILLCVLFFILLPFYRIPSTSFLPAKEICSSVSNFFQNFQNFFPASCNIFSLMTWKVAFRLHLCGILLWERLLLNILETDSEISLFIYDKPPRSELSKEALKTF